MASPSYPLAAQRWRSKKNGEQEHYEALVTQSSRQLSPDKQNWQYFFALCRIAVSSCD